MRGRLWVVAALALVLSGCGSGLPSAVPAGPTTVPVFVPATVPPTMPPAARATPPTTEGLPRPVPIPEDSYAREPIVEHGSIEIPAIGLSHTTFQGVTLNNIDQGPSHWPGTAQPGERGNAVFAGHRVTHSHPFRRIDELEPGDQVIFRAGGRKSVYEVTSDLVVTPQDIWIAKQTTEFTATLYACHPPGSVAYRYVVMLKLASTGPDGPDPT